MRALISAGVGLALGTFVCWHGLSTSAEQATQTQSLFLLVVVGYGIIGAVIGLAMTLEARHE